MPNQPTKMLNNVIQLVHTMLTKLLQKVFVLAAVQILMIRRFQIRLIIEHNVQISVVKDSLIIISVLINVFLLTIMCIFKVIKDVYKDLDINFVIIYKIVKEILYYTCKIISALKIVVNMYGQTNIQVMEINNVNKINNVRQQISQAINI